MKLGIIFESILSLNNVYDVPVDLLWKYREFDRRIDNIYGDKYLENLKNNIINNGISKPIKLQIDSNRKALVTDGNHRLLIARELGYKTLPTIVIDNDFGGRNEYKAKRISFDPSLWRRGDFDQDY